MADQINTYIGRQGIDTITTREKVRITIIEATHLKDNTANAIKVSNKMPVSGNFQMATVKTSKRVPNVILKRGNIHIGLVGVR